MTKMPGHTELTSLQSIIHQNFSLFSNVRSIWKNEVIASAQILSMSGTIFLNTNQATHLILPSSGNFILQFELQQIIEEFLITMNNFLDSIISEKQN